MIYSIPPAFTLISSSRKQHVKEDENPLSLSSRRSHILELIILSLPVLHWCMNPPLVPQPIRVPYTHPNFPLRILSSVSSVTGMIVVGETLPSNTGMSDTPEHYPTSLRYLRASHSILGGFWIGDQVATRANSAPLSDANGTPLGDPIYNAFVLQEAVRLVDTSDRAIKTGREKALFM